MNNFTKSVRIAIHGAIEVINDRLNEDISIDACDINFAEVVEYVVRISHLTLSTDEINQVIIFVFDKFVFDDDE
jgi:hypothetical protein